MKKELSEELIKEIEDKLTLEHGEEGEDWVSLRGLFHRGEEQLYAFKQPSRRSWEEFKRGMTAITMGKNKSIDPVAVERRLVVDCLIHPDVKVFNEQTDRRPAWIGKFSEKIVDLANGDIEPKKG